MVPPIAPLENNDCEQLSPSLLEDVDISWCYSGESSDSIVEVKVESARVKQEDEKEQGTVPAPVPVLVPENISGEQKKEVCEGSNETKTVIIKQSQMSQLDKNDIEIFKGGPFLENRPKRLRMRIQSCSVCFEDEDRIHQCEEAELILLCSVHNKINCFKYQFVIYLPAHGYITFLQFESEAQMSFLVKCFHALVGKYHLDLRFGSCRSKLFGSPTQIQCNSDSFVSFALPISNFKFIEKVRSFFTLNIQRMLTNMQPMGDKIMFKRFSFYHDDLAAEIITHSDKTEGIQYEAVINPEIAFMKCEHLICANSLF